MRPRHDMRHGVEDIFDKARPESKLKRSYNPRIAFHRIMTADALTTDYIIRL